MIKNPKKVKKTIHKAIIIGLATLTCMSFANDMMVEKQTDQTIDDFKKYMIDVRMLDEYKDYIDYQEKALYHYYKSGVLNANQFTYKINELKSDDHLCENGYKFLDEGVVEKINKLSREKNDAINKDNASGLSVFCGVVATGIVTGMYKNFYSEKEKEME